ncbi:amidase [Aureimonas sp. N4]|uniref:amidase n=1 Tax=Aureimonas sp. N4 TaxID=1638165 RepID=UPI0007822E44|nr:amidase [Aureimonas sp. N4]
MTSLLDLTASELLRRFRDRSLSPLDYWQAVEQRIEAFEPDVAALWAYDPDTAREEARASTERWARGAPAGPLDGIPVSVKELIATRGLGVPLGTAATVLEPAEVDAPAAARLREDGAIIFAKTTCPDYGMLSSGLSSFHKLSRNPWNLALNPGGSSSGASAAAAASYGPFHVGTDIGGSIRLPAGWTGIFGLKPSQGRIPVDPYYVGRCIGPMTRTVEDAALMMASLSRPDWRDGTSLPPEAISWTDIENVDVSGLRVGVMMDAGCGLPVEPEIEAAVRKAARWFEAAGARVFDVKPVLTREMLDGLDAFWRARFWGQMLKLEDARRALILPYILEWAEAGAQVSGVEAVRGFDQTMAMRKSCGALFQSVDIVLSPTNPIVSYPAEWPSPTNDPQRPFEHIAFTVPWNMSDQPAASVNCGFAASGMPIGLQIVGPRFADLTVLRMSRFVETRRGKMPAWPEPAALEAVA